MPRVRPRPAPRLRKTVEEARTDLYRLVDGFRKLRRPNPDLSERAVEIGPRRQGGAWLVPETDAQAAMERIEELEEELEDVAIGLLVTERLVRGSLEEDSSLAELARELGREHLL
jgi:diphthamide synthase subunit DPH2